MRRRALLLLFALLVLGVVAGLGATLRPTKSPPAESPRARTVRVHRVGEALSAWEHSYTGVVRARHESDLAFRVGGKIIERLVEVGSTVQTGQVLARLDPTDFQLAVKVAEAELASARAEQLQAASEYVRLHRLQVSGSVSQTEYDRAIAARDATAGQLDRAERSLSLARNRLAYCELTAQASGVVMTLPVEVGQVVAEGHTILRLAHGGEQEIVVGLPEQRVTDVHSARARVTFWAQPRLEIPATLRELAPSADPATRTYQARFRLESPHPRVHLGMTATVHLTSQADASGHVVPLASLTGSTEKPAVWVVHPTTSQVSLRPIAIREFRAKEAIVTGVRRGELVVSAGVQKLEEGMLIRPWEDEKR